MPTRAVEKRTLETLIGPLAKTFPQLDRATIQHSDQLTTERRTNPELRNQWFYTADGPMYTIEKEGRRDEAFLYLSRGRTNPVFNNIEEATQQLLRKGNYIPPKEDAEAVKSADTTLRVKLSDLKLQGNDSEWRYFEIDTANYDKLNPVQRRVAERVYGSGNEFVENVKMLNDNGIRTTRIYVLNLDYVKRNAPKDGALARACWLDDFGSGSDFDAGGGDVDSSDALRGVRNVAEGDAPKIANPILDAYNAILGADPGQALKAMTPEIATGLSGLLQMYKPQKQ